jgi:hypothetical protein
MPSPRNAPSPSPRRAKPRGEPPIGFVDFPLTDEFQADNAVRLVGWALDRKAVKAVTIEREPRPGDQAADLNDRGLVRLGTATVVQGARPDVSRVFPDYPNRHRASWTFELHRDDIARHDSFRAAIQVIAENVDGLTTILGRREIVFVAPDNAPPYLFCDRPFDSVFIEANGDVNPYPDCRPERPFGSLAEPGATLDSIWFGPAFTELRQRIINRDPPAMCLTCAHFINRNVNDPGYFDPR